MYIRTREDAIENLAQILALPERRDQILQSTVRLMLCLEVEPRVFLTDCQTLLLEGGLDALRSRCRSVADDSGDALFDDVASALDALRLVTTVRLVFPALRADRWQIARAILLYEPGIREQISEAVRGHADPDRSDRARGAVESMISALRPAWSDRLGAIRSACLETLKQSKDVDADQVHPEAETLFELFAISDQRAPELLEALDADDAVRASDQILHLRELAATARSLQKGLPPPDGPGQSREVA